MLVGRGLNLYSTHHYTKRDMLAYMSKDIARTIVWWSGGKQQHQNSCADDLHLHSQSL